jgi:UDP-N-acetylglucosamine 2-epimerase (non-hydrolysing)
VARWGVAPSPRRRVVVTYGTRPEAIKLAPVVAGLRAATWAHCSVAVSGQHRDLLDQVNAAFGIEADVDLDIFSPGQSLDRIAARAVTGLADVLGATRADALVVQGDTTSALAGALAGAYRQVPVVHVEAGLRSGDRRAPFPEELNRRMLAQVADLHLAPTAANRANLLAEGIDAGRIRVTGNTVIDAFIDVVGRRAPVGEPSIDDALAAGRALVVVTAHRRESWGAPLASVAAAVADLAEAHPDVLFVLPVHPNPLVRSALLPPVAGRANVVVCEPMGYAPFATLVAGARLVLTDSGGLQEEAPSVGVPVLVLRERTERQEAVAAGTVALVGTDRRRIVEHASRLLSDPASHRVMARAVNPYGDGQAATRCVAAIGALLGVAEALPDFRPPHGEDRHPRA